MPNEERDFLSVIARRLEADEAICFKQMTEEIATVCCTADLAMTRKETNNSNNL